MMKGLVIIPAYNEEHSIRQVVEDVIENAPGFDYIIINDCSTDKTKEICHKFNLNVINLPVNLGIGGAVQTGYLYAIEKEYDMAIQLDGDGQHHAKYIEKMKTELVDKGADMVIGSRFLDRMGFQSTGIRRIGILYFRTIIRICTRVNITDPTSGMRMVNKNVIEEFSKYYPKDYPEPESIAQLLSKKYRIREVSVEMKARTQGKSSITNWKSVYYIMKVSLAVIMAAMKR